MNLSSASAIYGEAEITPIESNIAVKFWVKASSDVNIPSAAFAHDDSLITAWIAKDKQPGHWLQLDLGGEYDNLRKTEVLFSGSKTAYQYRIEASSNGSQWDVVVDRSDNQQISEGFVDLFTRPATRFLRLTITGVSAGAVMGIREWRVFNYLRADIVNGADMSYMDQLRNQNYYLNPNPQITDMGPGPHVLDVVKDRGMRLIRLRIWNEPRNENTGALSDPAYISPARSAVVATWIKERGMQLGIDFHYADSWADPAKQPKPQSWAALEFDDLVAALHDFTYDYIKLLVEQGTRPDQVAIGNEIINGFLWGSEAQDMQVANPPYFIANKALYWSQPGGGLLWQYWNSTEPVKRQKYEAAWDRFSRLVAAGILAVREVSPDIAVEIHVVSDQGKLAKTMEFWSQLLVRLKTQGAAPDILAVSYYPEWHGTYQDLEQTLYAMASTYPQYKIQIAETAYPATGGDITMPNADQPLTIQGQANMLKRTIQAANDIINNQGTGVLVWEPQSFQPMFAAVSNMPNYFEPYASIDVYNKAFARNILEHNVYITTLAKTPPALPESVQVLAVSTSLISAATVTWKVVDPLRYENPGSFTVSGATEFGSVTATITVIYHSTGVHPPAYHPPVAK